MRSDDRSWRVTSGASVNILIIVGTQCAIVTRWRSMSAAAAAGVNCGRYTWLQPIRKPTVPCRSAE